MFNMNYGETILKTNSGSKDIAITVIAKVMETATAVELEGTHTTKPFVDDEIILKFDAPKQYKPGFIYKVKVERLFFFFLNCLIIIHAGDVMSR